MLRIPYLTVPVINETNIQERFENIKANIEIWPSSNTGKLEDDFRNRSVI